MTFATRRLAGLSACVARLSGPVERSVMGGRNAVFAGRIGAIDYLPENRVGRFSTNAIAPSRKSSLEAISR